MRGSKNGFTLAPPLWLQLARPAGRPPVPRPAAGRRRWGRSGGGSGDGSAGGSKGSKGAAGGDGNAPDLKAELEAAKAKIRELEAKTSGKGGSGKDGDDDPDLNEKVRKDREAREAAGAREKKLEKSLRFTMGAQDFLKQNEALLPQEAADILPRPRRKSSRTPSRRMRRSRPD
jgi:hypothetical protein